MAAIYKVRITVANGWVELNGKVDWTWEKEDAERAVHRLTGVRGVTNPITVVPRLKPSPERVRQRIEDALVRDAMTDNRTPSKVGPLIAQGARLANQPAEAVPPGGIVVSVVADDRALEEIVRSPGFVEQLGSAGIHLSMSTVPPVTARKLAALHAEHGSTYVAAPVFGRPEAAASRHLWICVAGPRAARERAQPVLKALGQGIFDFGEDPEAANVIKLCGNFLTAAALEAMAEALTMAEKSGLDRSAVIEMLTRTIFTDPVYQNYGEMIAQQRHTPAGFRESLGLKDVDLVREVADPDQMPMPFASVLRDRMPAGVAKGRGDMDWSALALDVREDAGLKLRDSA